MASHFCPQYSKLCHSGLNRPVTPKKEQAQIYEAYENSRKLVFLSAEGAETGCALQSSKDGIGEPRGFASAIFPREK